MFKALLTGEGLETTAMKRGDDVDFVGMFNGFGVLPGILLCFLSSL